MGNFSREFSLDLNNIRIPLIVLFTGQLCFIDKRKERRRKNSCQYL